MNPVHFNAEQGPRMGRVQCGSAIDLLLRLAFGEVVTQADALRVLHAQPERDETRRISRLARIKARNAALLDAAEALGGDAPGEWVIATRLADAIDRFEIRYWPRLVVGQACDLSPSELAIYRAFLSGERVPKTPRRLYDLLK